MSIFFYKRLLGTDAINSLLFFKDVFFSLIEKGPGNKDIYLLSSKLNVKNATPTFLELGPAWAKEISHQTLDTELSDLARPMAGGRAPWRLINSAAEKKICVVSEVRDASCRSRPVSDV